MINGTTRPNVEFDWRFPHIKYMTDPKRSKSKQLWYMGGEPEENHKRLTVGKKYNLYTVLYSERSEDKRKKVWVCGDDENQGKMCRINLKNFGFKSDLRNKKINEILK
jgi:hypothetical protein